MQEIQSSGETDPEIWKDCQVRSSKKANYIMMIPAREQITLVTLEVKLRSAVTGGLVRCVGQLAASGLSCRFLFDRCLTTVAG